MNLTRTTFFQRFRSVGPCAVLCCLVFLHLADGSARAADLHPHRRVAPNGLTVLVLEQHALPIVRIHVLVKAGAAQDPHGKAGLANMVASLLDEGTDSRSANDIAEAIDFVGGSLATHATKDYTTVSVSVLKKDRDLGFSLLSDLLLHANFPKKEISRMRAQILGDIQNAEDNPVVVAENAFNPLVFGNHPYRWPVVGTTKSVKTISRKDLWSFYVREYVPNQTIVTIVGDIRLDEVTQKIDQHFGAWEPGSVAPRHYNEPGLPPKPVIKLVQKELSQATILLGHIGIQRADPEYFSLTVMNYILGSGGFSSRLMDSIRDRQGLVYGVYSAFETSLMPGPFFVSLQTRPEKATLAIEQVVKELDGMQHHPVSDQELADAKSYLIGSFPRRLDTTSKLARVLTLVEFYSLGLDYFTSFPEQIAQVTADDVLRVAKQFLHPDRYVLVVVGDQAKVNMQPQ